MLPLLFRCHAWAPNPTDPWEKVTQLGRTCPRSSRRNTRARPFDGVPLCRRSLFFASRDRVNQAARTCVRRLLPSQSEVLDLCRLVRQALTVLHRDAPHEGHRTLCPVKAMRAYLCLCVLCLCVRACLCFYIHHSIIATTLSFFTFRPFLPSSSTLSLSLFFLSGRNSFSLLPRTTFSPSLLRGEGEVDTAVRLLGVLLHR